MPALQSLPASHPQSHRITRSIANFPQGTTWDAIHCSSCPAISYMRTCARSNHLSITNNNAASAPDLTSNGDPKAVIIKHQQHSRSPRHWLLKRSKDRKLDRRGSLHHGASDLRRANPLVQGTTLQFRGSFQEAASQTSRLS